MIIDYKLIGMRLQRARRAQKRTQEMLAEYLDVSVGYVSQLERGVSKINLETLARICTFLNYDICAVLSGASRQNTDYLDEEIVTRLRELDGRQKNVVLDMIDSLARNQA